jgi:hypothetical protein
MNAGVLPVSSGYNKRRQEGNIKCRFKENSNAKKRSKKLR